MASAVNAISVAVVVFLICFIGIGWGVGRLWNAKWKFGLSGVLVSVAIGLLCSVLGLVYVSMGFVKDSMLAVSAKTVLVENITKDITENAKLMEMAFKEGVKNMVAVGVGTDTLDPEGTVEFTFPGETDTDIRTNQEAFIAGVTKALALGDNSKKPSKSSRISALADIPPFSYGLAPISRDGDGEIYSSFQEALQGREGQPVSVEDGWWFNNIGGTVINKSVKLLDSGIAKGVDSQRTNALVLMIILMILEAAVISLLALSDIRTLNRASR